MEKCPHCLMICMCVFQDVVVHCWKLVMSILLFFRCIVLFSCLLSLMGQSSECGNLVFRVLETHRKIKGPLCSLFFEFSNFSQFLSQYSLPIDEKRKKSDILIMNSLRRIQSSSIIIHNITFVSSKQITHNKHP